MHIWPDWRTALQAGDGGPGINYLHQANDLKVVLVTLQPGQALPPHPGPSACFHFLDGTGVMLVDGEEQEVTAGATAIAPAGSVRSVRATGRLVFLGNLGDPAAEDGPH